MSFLKKFGASIAKVAISIFVPKKYKDISNTVVSTIEAVNSVDNTIIKTVVNSVDVSTTGKLAEETKTVLIKGVVNGLTKTATAVNPNTGMNNFRWIYDDDFIAKMTEYVVSLIGLYELQIHLIRTKEPQAKIDAVKSQINGVKRTMSTDILLVVLEFSKGVVVKYIETYFVNKIKG